MPGSLTVVFGGETLRLLGERAIYWPRHRRLLIADLHLGKGDVFRRAGIAVPRGGTSHDLARLDGLIERTAARELFVLGDLLHGPTPEAAWRRTWLDWRTRHAALRIAVLAGNHDVQLAHAGLGIEALPESVTDAPFLLSHLPGEPAALPVICGHIHPTCRLEGRRWPCFWRQGLQLVLPAFSAFTGGHSVGPGDGWIGLCVEDGVIALGAG